MKSYLLVVAMLLPIFSFSQDEKATTSYTMFESMYMKPKIGARKALSEKLGAHNKRFHASGPHGTRMYHVRNGKHTGSLVWLMGPCTWSQHDHRPQDQAHDDDWRDNVLPLMESISQGEYWKLDSKLNHFPEPKFELAKQRIWVIDIRPFESHRFRALLEKVKDVDTKDASKDAWGLYWNQLQSTNSGRDAAIVWFFDKWSWLDEDDQFSQRYEKVHGPGSWRIFLREWEEVVAGMEVELRTYIPEMSGLGATVDLTARQ